jgi:RNA-binding protein YlmH
MMYLYPTLFAAVLTITSPTTSAFTVDRRHYDRSVRVDVPRTTPLRFSVDDVESQAQAASEAWDVYVTSFLGTAEAALVQERLQGRGDVACFRVGGAAAPSRARFVFTNPELGMESAAAEEEYCVVLCVKNAKSGQDPWPNMLTKIGVDLENVGDVLLADGTIYLAVTPEVAKQCTRLLPKEVVGAGVMVKALEPGEAMPEDGELQEMEVKRLDKRAQYSAQKGK